MLPPKNSKNRKEKNQLFERMKGVVIHSAARNAVHFLGGGGGGRFGGMLPGENFKKYCNLVHFRVYFDCDIFIA